jgi:glucosamine-6-phosphate deaminase
VKIEVLSSAAEVAARGAAFFGDLVRANPRLVAALPTGRTPIAMYQKLAAERAASRFDLGEAVVFNLDEVLLPRQAPQTFFQFMTRHAWDPLGVRPDRRFIPDCEAKDPEEECLRYEAALARHGRLDVAILGIGSDGHIAYNLPHQAGPLTHVVTLDPLTIKTLGGGLKGPIRAITMGVRTIHSAKRLLLLATSGSKAEALRRMRADEVSEAWPCTFFRDHPDLTVLADRAAAAQL